VDVTARIITGDALAPLLAVRTLDAFFEEAEA